MSEDAKQIAAATEFQAPTMQPAPLPSRTVQISNALTKMADANVDPASLEKMMKLYQELIAMDAKQDYIKAMSQFQARCPIIVKHKSVRSRNGGTLYSYAPLADIDQQTRGLREQCGLSHTFDFEPTDGGLSVTCTVTHIGGHSETTKTLIPATKGMNTSAAQDQGIMMQYGMRYSLIAAYGITTADDDTDANQLGGGSQGAKPITDKQKSTIADLLAASGRDQTKFLQWLGVGAIDEIQASQYARAEAALKKAAEKPS